MHLIYHPRSIAVQNAKLLMPKEKSKLWPNTCFSPANDVVRGISA